MSNKVSQFSEIHTPSSYPASEKRYVDGSRVGLRDPIERSLSRLRITVRAPKSILPCLCMTPQAPIPTPRRQDRHHS
jgi:hypothetical protein